MSIWTCRPGLAAAAAVLLLSGCDLAPDVTRRDGGPLRMPPETVAVAGRTVIVGGPAGYCVDRKASRLRGETAFVLLGSCASIAGDARAGAPRTPGVLMASVGADAGSGPTIGAVIDRLAQYLTSAQGRAALARDGRAESVTILDSRREEGALFVHLRDTSPDVVPGVAQDYWRGLFEVNRHLVTVSVVSFTSQPMGTDAGLQVLREFHARIQTETLAEASGGNPARPRLLGNLFN